MGYCGLGIAFSFVAFVLVFYWSSITASITGTEATFDAPGPQWLRLVGVLARNLDLVVLAILVAATVRHPPRLRAVVYALGVGLGNALVFGWLFFGWVAEDYVSRTTFNSATWRRVGGTFDSVRLRMVDDLIDSKALDGRSREQVLTLLGPADEPGKFAEWNLVYWLGPERGMLRLDSEWLVIRFADDGRVAGYRIVRD